MRGVSTVRWSGILVDCIGVRGVSTVRLIVLRGVSTVRLIVLV